MNTNTMTTLQLRTFKTQIMKNTYFVRDCKALWPNE